MKRACIVIVVVLSAVSRLAAAAPTQKRAFLYEQGQQSTSNRAVRMHEAACCARIVMAALTGAVADCSCAAAPTWAARGVSRSACILRGSIALDFRS